jgi:hypothetical protein
VGEADKTVAYMKLCMSTCLDVYILHCFLPASEAVPVFQ